ncbi:MAG TPA: hypothetical protein VNU45_03605, partial [Rummeliibacillus sp.]|nr:hypothetical protein [Rummeliibacillus sp.]
NVRGKEPQLKFRDYHPPVLLVLSICTLVFSPLVILLMPLILSETIYFDRDNWIIVTPNVNYILIAVSSLCILFILLLFYFFKINMYSLSIGSGLLIISLLLVYASAKSCIIISEQGIQTQGPITKKHTYDWKDIKRIDNQLEKSAGTRRHYIFYFHNGEKLTIMQNGLFTHEVTSKIYWQAKYENIDFNEY